jgi:type IV pilus assembly protein PilQ
MRHFSLPLQNNSCLPIRCSLLVLALLLFQGSQVCMATENSVEQNIITAVNSVQDNKTLNITLEGTTTPTYTVYELFKPARIVVDIADSTIADNASLALPEESQVTLTTSTIADTTPPLTRFTFTLKESRQFSVVQKDNNIVISLTISQQAPEIAQTEATQTAQTTSLEINDIKILTTPDQTKVQLLANNTIPSYTYDVLDKKGDTPPRLYIDINNVTGETLLKEQNVGTALAAIRVAQRGTGLRFVLDSSQDSLFPFQVTSLKNGIEIRIQETAKADDLSELIQQKQTIESHLPQVDPLQQKTEEINAQSVANSMQDAFNFSGYNKERITVDFYKIDLHNVFRLLREVSKTNIVVDDAVSGSLTLGLNDVPWDFALDIILNLKDLQKEERFNTIVILPKSKAFNWPERAEDNLSFEADEAVTEQEAILIQQQMNIPKTVVAAKQFISKAQVFEKREEYENAVHQYDLALEKWPENAQLANKISSLYLVYLRQNAKALYYAEKALKVNPKIAGASLNAAIASANMQENKNAQQYFAQSVQGKKPLRDALLSYAVFSEEQERFTEAIKLLEKHDTLYGENLNSMIAQARIFDKQGNHENATTEYKKILYSGYRIAPDLKKYIQGRIALSQPM